MKKWHHLLINEPRLDALQKQLEDYEEAGWELVSLASGKNGWVAALKRPQPAGFAMPTAMAGSERPAV
jgi:hypothetical protein